MPHTVAIDPSGNKRVLMVVGVGPKTSSQGAEHFFEVHLLDIDGDPVGDDPLFGPLSRDEAVAAARRYAAENKLGAG